MKFIRKHTEGPWPKNPINSPAYMGCNEPERHANLAIISQAPVMLDYLIERAKKLNKRSSALEIEISTARKCGNYTPEEIEEYEYVNSELTRLLEIIRAAGVEVLYE